MQKEKNAEGKKEQELKNAAYENARLKDELHAKSLQLKQIETDVAVLKERVTETKSRLLEAEKQKKRCFMKRFSLIKGNSMKVISGSLLILPILMHFSRRRRRLNKTRRFLNGQNRSRRCFKLLQSKLISSNNN